MAKGWTGRTHRVPRGILSFPSLDKPKGFKGETDPEKLRYQADCILDMRKPEHKAVYAAVLEDIADAKKQTGRDTFKIECRGKGVNKKDKEGKIYSGYEGEHIRWVSAKSKKRPLLVNTRWITNPDTNKKENERISPNDPGLEGGMLVNYSFHLYISEDYPERINAQLRGIQATGKGEPFGGGASAATEFEGFNDSGDEEDANAVENEDDEDLG